MNYCSRQTWYAIIAGVLLAGTFVLVGLEPKIINVSGGASETDPIDV